MGLVLRLALVLLHSMEPEQGQVRVHSKVLEPVLVQVHNMALEQARSMALVRVHSSQPPYGLLYVQRA
jgi:hypothetical protein